MRERPIIQWLIFLGFWACLALPITLVTHGKRTIQKPQDVEISTVMTWVTLRFSTKPSYFELLQNDKVLWREDPVDNTEFDNAFPVSIDKFGAEFILRSRLSTGSAIEISIEPDARGQRSQTLWVDGDVDEALTFSWSPDV